MLNVLVTGSNGQLGSEIRELKDEFDYNFFFTCKDEFDICSEIKEYLVKNKIDVIINCAAYTAVDKAEDEKELADKVNHIAVKNLTFACKELNIKLIHISTDYVFDGKNHKPYSETDATNPTSVYGKSKLDGELAMQVINPKNSIIIRTSWVYSGYGANFVKTMFRLGKEKESLGVVYDQIGTPTYAYDLALAILQIIPQLQNDSVEVYHYSNEGVTSWYDFAKEIMRMAKLACKVNPIETYQYPTPATRPHFSVLNKSKIKNDFGLNVEYYKDSLDKCLRKMGARN